MGLPRFSKVKVCAAITDVTEFTQTIKDKMAAEGVLDFQTKLMFRRSRAADSGYNECE